MADTAGETETSGYETEIEAGRPEIAEVLQGVVDGVVAGYVRLGTEPDTVDVGFPDDLSIEIEFEEGDDHETSLELELEWPVSDGPTDLSVESRSEGVSEQPTPVNVGDGSESWARFEVYRDRGGEWRWRLRHRNGEVIAVSGEGYTRKHNARKGLRSVIGNSTEAEITEASLE